MPAARLQLSLRQVDEPHDRPEEHAAQQARHRRAYHALHRPLHHVLALRPLHARDRRHGGIAGRSAAAIIPRSTSSPAIRSTTSWRATSSICARSGRWPTRISSTSSASGSSRAQKSVCAGCSTGCSIHVDHNKDIVYRIRPRENPQAQGYFICDEGRFDYSYVNARERFQQPLAPLHGQTQSPAGVGKRRCRAAHRADRRGPAQWQGRSPRSFRRCSPARRRTCSRNSSRACRADAKLYLGWVPVVGQDDRFPQDRKGNPVGAGQVHDPCREMPEPPRRRGSPQAFPGRGARLRPAAWPTLLDVDALYLTAGYLSAAGAVAQRGSRSPSSARLPLLVVQDLMPSPISQAARFVLPAASFAEKDGCFVNHANLAQEIALGGSARLDGPHRRPDFPEPARAPRPDSGGGGPARAGPRDALLRPARRRVPSASSA